MEIPRTIKIHERDYTEEFKDYWFGQCLRDMTFSEYLEMKRTAYRAWQAGRRFERERYKKQGDSQ